MGDIPIFIIKHNTDYIYFAFTQKRKFVWTKTPLRFA